MSNASNDYASGRLGFVSFTVYTLIDTTHHNVSIQIGTIRSNMFGNSRIERLRHFKLEPNDRKILATMFPTRMGLVLKQYGWNFVFLHGIYKCQATNLLIPVMAMVLRMKYTESRENMNLIANLHEN